MEEEAKVSHNHIERYKREFRAPNGTPLYLTKQNVTERFGEFERRKIETFEKLEATYTKEQVIFNLIRLDAKLSFPLASSKIV